MESSESRPATQQSVGAAENAAGDGHEVSDVGVVRDTIVAAPDNTETTLETAAGQHYYWEEPGSEAPVTTVVAHTLHWLFSQVFVAAELVGEVFSDIMGLENPRYNWAVEAEQNRVDQFDEDERLREQRERWELIQRLNSSRAGSASQATAIAGAVAPLVNVGSVEKSEPLSPRAQEAEKSEPLSPLAAVTERSLTDSAGFKTTSSTNVKAPVNTVDDTGYESPGV